MQHGLTRGSPNVCWRGRCWDVFRSLVAHYLWGQAFAQVNLCLQICFQTGSLLLRHADLWQIFLYSILVSERISRSIWRDKTQNWKNFLQTSLWGTQQNCFRHPPPSTLLQLTPWGRTTASCKAHKRPLCFGRPRCKEQDIGQMVADHRFHFRVAWISLT